MEKFNVGDVVCLKSDKDMPFPQRMTINAIDENGAYSCVWFKDGEIRGASFNPEALTICD